MIQGSCGQCCVRREPEFDIENNRVDCEVNENIRLILLKLFLRNISNALIVNPFVLVITK